MENTVGLRDLRHRTREVIQRAQSTGTVVTDRGIPVAVISPAPHPNRAGLDRALEILESIETESTGWSAELTADKQHDLEHADRF